MRPFGIVRLTYITFTETSFSGTFLGNFFWTIGNCLLQTCRLFCKFTKKFYYFRHICVCVCNKSDPTVRIFWKFSKWGFFSKILREYWNL